MLYVDLFDQSVHLDSSAKNKAKPPQSMYSLELKFDNAKQRFPAVALERLVDRPLSIWTLPSDRHLPSALIQMSLRTILEMSFEQLDSIRGVGTTRVEKLIQVVDRALSQLEKATGVTGPDGIDRITNDEKFGTHEADASETDGGDRSLSFRETRFDSPQKAYSDVTLDLETWQKLTSSIREHGFEWQPIGRFANSLNDLPRGLWGEPLEKFVSLPMQSLLNTPGLGDSKVSSIIQIIIELANSIRSCDPNTHFRFQVYPASINRITNWINQVLASNTVPDVLSLSQHFVMPLLKQIELDLGIQVAEMVERRLGANGVPQTLQEVAEEFQLTRERIRQITLRVPEVMQIRWPEGKHLFDDFFEKFHNDDSATEQVGLVRRTLDLFFNIDVPERETMDSILIAWETAGRRKETPMSESEIHCWLGGNFPRLQPELGFQLIKNEAQNCEFNGTTIYFSNDELDRLLHQLYVAKTATTINDLCQLDERDERNLRNRMLRDLRFIEDEDRQWQPTESHGFVRDSCGWHAELIALDKQKFPGRTMIAVDNLAGMAAGALTRLGIFDVTVWGFHRFVGEMLSSIYNARLRPETNPFVLADMVVRLTSGLIRPMRRRRLRWDKDNLPYQAKGKRGWIEHVVNHLGVPIVLDELGGLLNAVFQDYAPYALAQLNLDSEEDGSTEFSVALIPGVPHKVPQLIVPERWSFDSVCENVSEGVKIAVARGVVSAKDGTLMRSDLVHIPWFCELVNKYSYGEDIWKSRKSEQALRSGEPESTPSLPVQQFFKSFENEVEVATKPKVVDLDVDDLLSRFI